MLLPHVSFDGFGTFSRPDSV